MTFREAAQSYHESLRRQPLPGGVEEERRRRQEYELDEYVIPEVGDVDVLELSDAMADLERSIRSLTGNGASESWVRGTIRNVRTIIRRAPH